MFYKPEGGGDLVLNFATTGDNNVLWPSILQKAFAKLKGSYSDANGGFVTTGITSLTGAPVFDYLSYEERDPQDVFDRMKAANDLHYILGAGTFGDDDFTNDCGVVAGHAYSVIAAFELKTGDNVDAQVYMVRNPYGSTYHSGGIWTDQTCSNTDNGNADSYGDACNAYTADVADAWCGEYDTFAFNSYSMCCACGGGLEATSPWTDEYRAQVPHTIDTSSAANDGIFFLDKSEFLGCFDDFQIAHYRDDEGFTDDWYDDEGDNSSNAKYEITVPEKRGDLYFTVETYYYNMIPSMCQYSNVPLSQWTVYKNNVAQETHYYYEYQSYPYMVEESSYEAGDVFTINVDYTWYGVTVEDYTVKVYSQ